MSISIDEKLIGMIKNIKVLILDVDGVMTDGRIVIDDLGNEEKNFDVKDGHGLKLLMRHGVDVIFLTGRTSKVVEYRAHDLGVKEVYQGSTNKVATLQEIIKKREIEEHSVAYIGDDLIDIPVLNRVGFSAAVADACQEAKDAADYVTIRKGGRGAVREVCEIILKAQGTWNDVALRYGFDPS
jgi:3-deoxy-D-manno-octulosonate 8-phosphate phosphatase (KDO 8-P phosphatase)